MKKILFSFALCFIFLFYLFGAAVFAAEPVLKCGSCCETVNCASGLRCDGAGTPCDVTKNLNTGQCVDQDVNVTTFCPFSSLTDIKELVASITKWIFILALVIAPLMVLTGGFYMLTSAGDPTRSTKGKNIIIWAMIGLGVILFAKAFIAVIKFVLK